MEYSGITRSEITKDLIILAVLSVLTKVILVFVTTGFFNSFIDLFDISYYLKFCAHIYSGEIPYIDFSVDYPQLAFLPFLISFGGALLFGNAMAYVYSHAVLMVIFDILSISCLYFIILSLFGRHHAMISSILYATAFSSAYFVITKYDAFPTFFLMLSLLLMVHQRSLAGYVSSTLGFLSKWFPAIAFPYFIIHDLKGGVSHRTIVLNIGICIAIVLAFMLPFLIISPYGFISTYTLYGGEQWELAHSFIYYLDYILSNSIGISAIGSLSIIIVFILQIGLIFQFYRKCDRSHTTLIYYIFLALFLFIIVNKLFSPQYILWITPFFALFLGLARWWGVVLFYINQIWMYLEFPLLYRVIYTNTGYYLDGGNWLISTPFVFFTIKYVIFFGILYAVVFLIYPKISKKNLYK